MKIILPKKKEESECDKIDEVHFAQEKKSELDKTDEVHYAQEKKKVNFIDKNFKYAPYAFLTAYIFKKLWS